MPEEGGEQPRESSGVLSAAGVRADEYRESEMAGYSFSGLIERWHEGSSFSVRPYSQAVHKECEPASHAA